MKIIKCMLSYVNFMKNKKDMHKAYPNYSYKLFNSSVIARIASSTLEASLPPA